MSDVWSQVGFMVLTAVVVAVASDVKTTMIVQERTNSSTEQYFSAINKESSPVKLYINSQRVWQNNTHITISQDTDTGICTVSMYDAQRQDDGKKYVVKLENVTLWEIFVHVIYPIGLKRLTNTLIEMTCSFGKHLTPQSSLTVTTEERKPMFKINDDGMLAFTRTFAIVPHQTREEIVKKIMKMFCVVSVNESHPTYIRSQESQILQFLDDSQLPSQSVEKIETKKNIVIVQERKNVTVKVYPKDIPKEFTVLKSLYTNGHIVENSTHVTFSQDFCELDIYNAQDLHGGTYIVKLDNATLCEMFVHVISIEFTKITNTEINMTCSLGNYPPPPTGLLVTTEKNTTLVKSNENGMLVFSRTVAIPSDLTKEEIVDYLASKICIISSKKSHPEYFLPTEYQIRQFLEENQISSWQEIHNEKTIINVEEGKNITIQKNFTTSSEEPQILKLYGSGQPVKNDFHIHFSHDETTGNCKIRMYDVQYWHQGNYTVMSDKIIVWEISVHVTRNEPTEVTTVEDISSTMEEIVNYGSTTVKQHHTDHTKIQDSSKDSMSLRAKPIIVVFAIFLVSTFVLIISMLIHKRQRNI